jgi:hypothetical protein
MDFDLSEEQRAFRDLPRGDLDALVRRPPPEPGE